MSIQKNLLTHTPLQILTFAAIGSSLPLSTKGDCELQNRISKVAEQIIKYSTLPDESSEKKSLYPLISEALASIDKTQPNGWLPLFDQLLTHFETAKVRDLTGELKRKGFHLTLVRVEKSQGEDPAFKSSLDLMNQMQERICFSLPVESSSHEPKKIQVQYIDLQDEKARVINPLHERVNPLFHSIQFQCTKKSALNLHRESSFGSFCSTEQIRIPKTYVTNAILTTGLIGLSLIGYGAWSHFAS